MRVAERTPLSPEEVEERTDGPVGGSPGRKGGGPSYRRKQR
jgi:hypothetical protein